MIDRRTWVPVAVAVTIGTLIAGVLLLGRSDVEVSPLGVSVSDGSEQLDLDAAIYRPGAASADDPRPAVLLAHGFLGDRSGVDAQARRLAGNGFVVMTWSARGFGASQGRVGLADPDAEIADVSRLIDVLAERPEVRLDAAGDPRVAIVGGSYGAGTALLAAAQEPRLDAVVAAAGWHSLSRSLAPNGVTGPGEVAPGVLKAGWTSLLFTANALPADAFTPPSSEAPPPTDPQAPPADPEPGVDVESPAGTPADGPVADVLDGDLCGRFSREICEVYLEVGRSGVLTDSARAVLDARSPAGRLDAVTAPTLLLQGQDDTLFDLTESRRNAEEIAAGGAPVRLRWVVGGHEIVGGAADEESRAEIDAWLERWLFDTDGPEAAAFTWTDQAADATRDRNAPPARPSPGGEATRDVLEFELTADGRLHERDGATDVANDVPRSVMLNSPPGGQPAALSSLPGGGALVGFLPATDIPGQHVAITSAPMIADTTLLGPPTMSLQVRSSVATDDADGPAAGDDADQPGDPVDDGGEVRVFVKLSDVADNGSTTLIHQAVTPVRATSLPSELAVELPDVAYRLRAGHRLRVTIATTDQAFSNRLDGATTRLVLGDGAAQLQLPVVDSVTPAARWPVVVGIVLAASALAALLWALRRRHGAPSVTSSGGVDPAHRPGDDRSTGAGPGAATTGTPATAKLREPPPIAIQGLTKRYADGHLAVDRFDLTVGRGQVMGLLGPNGAGKTTSLRMLLGLSTPTAGSIQVFGHDMRPGHPVLGRIGALVEGPGFVPELSGIDNLQLYWRAGGRRSLDEADLPWALGVADLGDAVRKPVRTYSHGMKQRLAIAQALLGHPELLVLDEPTDGLDPEQIRAMRELLARLGDEGHTVLVSSHLLAEVEQMCTHVAVVQRGRLLASGSIGELVGAGRTVVVETDDRERARAVLARHLPPGSIEASGAGLAVTLDGRDPADLVTWLVADGLRIRALTPRGKLEDAFLSLTGPSGSGPDASSETIGSRAEPGGRT